MPRPKCDDDHVFRFDARKQGVGRQRAGVWRIRRQDGNHDLPWRIVDGFLHMGGACWKVSLVPNGGALRRGGDPSFRHYLVDEKEKNVQFLYLVGGTIGTRRGHAIGGAAMVWRSNSMKPKRRRSWEQNKIVGEMLGVQPNATLEAVIKQKDENWWPEQRPSMTDAEYARLSNRLRRYRPMPEDVRQRLEEDIGTIGILKSHWDGLVGAVKKKERRVKKVVLRKVKEAVPTIPPIGTIIRPRGDGGRFKIWGGKPAPKVTSTEKDWFGNPITTDTW